MGMYTEFYFRADVQDGPVADWLDEQINGDGSDPDGGDWFENGYDDHPFFKCDRWDYIFKSGGAVYQESRPAVFRLKGTKDGINGVYSNQLVVASSLKNGAEADAFVDWITPHLDMLPGDFLGYSLFEDSRPSGWGTDTGPNRDCPRLYFVGGACAGD